MKFLQSKWSPLVAVLLFAPTFLHISRNEGGSWDALYAASVTLALAGLVLVCCRRVLVASVLVNAVVAIIVTVASAKQRAMDTALHAYDIVFYLGSWSTLTFLWTDYRVYVLAFFAVTVGLFLAVWIAARIDPTRVGRRAAGLASLLLIALAALASQQKSERRHMQYYLEEQHVGAFYASWAETAETLWRGQLMEAAQEPASSFAALRSAADCATQRKPPHIILIHEESVVPPGHFPGLDYDRGLDSFFRSHDARSHRLRVETYGGASWLTEFSVLAGLSSRSFGGMRLFVEALMAGRLRDTLPQALARCGYRNVVFYPLLRNFVSNAKFYASIGIGEVFDAKDQKAPTYSERDRFYFGNMLDEIDRHVRRSEAPMFAFVQTMATHSPYDTAFMPEESVAGGGPGTDPEMNEYLRRLAMAKRDYEEMKQALATRFPGEQFLIVHYGDHQPIATRGLLGLGKALEADDIVLPETSPGMLTYYAVDGINYVPPPLPAVDALDVPYIPLVILQSARLPVGEAFQERRRLLALCNGLYFACKQKDEILRFHRRLIDSGLVDARLR